MTRLVLLAALALLGSSAASAQDARPETVPIDRVVAVVGNEVILWSDVLEEINVMRAQGRELPSDSAQQMTLAREIIGRLVETELLVQRAQQDSVLVNDIDLTQQVDARMRQVRGQFQTEQEFLELLRTSGFGSIEEYRRWLTDEQRRNALQEQLIQKLRAEGKLPPAPVSEEEVQRFFDENKGQVPRLPATVTFRQIVVPVTPSERARQAARAKAESLLVELRRGGNFEQVAKRESMDPASRETGGDLGWRRRGGGAEGLVPEFEYVIFQLGPGQLSPVFETSFGFHIARVDRVQPAEVKARHILIRPKLDSIDVAAARARADSVANAWRAGASLDSLVARFHDPIEERSIPNPFPRNQLPEPYQKAVEGHQANDILDPFEIPDAARDVPKFVIVQITSMEPEREPSLGEFRQQIREQLAQQKAVRRLFENLREATFVSVRI
ncbi:MAG: peptidylprolyl isomerase [Gemmatimonadaceae bacterium]